MSKRNQALQAITDDDLIRYWQRVAKTDSCWEWIGTKSSYGYGQFSVKRVTIAAHRVTFWIAHHSLPKTIDHLCRNRACVNPAHLEAVTNAENVLRGQGPTAENARKQTCPYGHSEWGRKGTRERYCRPCKRAYNRRYRRKIRTERAAAIRAGKE